MYAPENEPLNGRLGILLAIQNEWKTGVWRNPRKSRTTDYDYTAYSYFVVRIFPGRRYL